MLSWLIGQLFKASKQVDERDVLADWEQALIEDDAWESIYHGLY